jgi:predicted acyl esterase
LRAARVAYNGSMSTKPNALTVFLLVPLLTSCITAQTPDAPGSSKYDIAAFPNIMVPMRNDVRLATNIYRPAENGEVVEGKFPVILERTPYGKENDVYYANYWVK